jgi:hypothetical protein
MNTVAKYAGVAHRTGEPNLFFRGVAKDQRNEVTTSTIVRKRKKFKR